MPASCAAQAAKGCNLAAGSHWHTAEEMGNTVGGQAKPEV